MVRNSPLFSFLLLLGKTKNIFLLFCFCTTQESFSTGTENKKPGITHLPSYSKHQVGVPLGTLFSWWMPWNKSDFLQDLCAYGFKKHIVQEPEGCLGKNPRTIKSKGS